VGYEFACENVVPGCEGKVDGETPDTVLARAAAHAKEAHGLENLDPATVEKIKASIVSTS
jgi:predicted small metal-binding protein